MAAFICFFFIFWNVVLGSRPCESPQYIRISSVGIIQCSFTDDMYSLLWFNSTNLNPDNAILTTESSVKSGRGFDSREFDIFPNGSLIITNVSLEHEETYTVIKLATPTSNPVTYTVSVSVIAQTFDRVPVISNCSSGSEICFEIFNPTSEISCALRDARPAIPVSLMARTINSDQNISSSLVFKNETHPFVTSRVTTTEPFTYSLMLTLLVCKADGPPGLLERSESLLLLQNTEESLPSVDPKQIFVEENSKLQLLCTDSNTSYLVWQAKDSPEDVFKSILYAAFVGENLVHEKDEEYRLHADSSIVVDRVRVHHEGPYRCISGNGIEDQLTLFDVAVFVTPDTQNLVVDGCNHKQYCVLEVQPEGNLTCNVKRIRPRVDLDITGVFEKSSSNINFYEKETTIKDNGRTFDVSITSKFRFNGAAESRLTAECKVLGTEVDALQLSTKFDLLFLQGAGTTTEEGILADVQKNRIIAVVLLVVLVLVLVVTCGLVILKVRRERVRKRRTNLSKHGVAMMPKGDLSGKKDIFISQLKAKYQDLYDTVQPIPYIRDRLYCVDRVFVEGGIEFLKTKGEIEGKSTWEKLDTYHNILNDSRVSSTRRILEGEPGYGKSTLTLQFAYDWCNQIPHSSLKDTSILILLRLRQLGGVPSIYRAIRQFLLPKDSKLNENDIKDILSNSSSVVVILDGYDEYPDQDTNEDSDVISIIVRNMFQHFYVILTTRSPYLPKKVPGLTKRLKLTGFDDNARDQYIRKAVVGDDEKAAKKIKQKLKENPVLSDLCHVPLIFVMFAHMSHESKKFPKFKSVTSFFRYMISCFHSHFKNKMEDENIEKYDVFETNHRVLDKIAFEGLSGKGQQIVWSKKYMCERLGLDFYEQYVRIGILVEDEVLDISDDPTSEISKHIQYKTEARFYHKLFCEWYAAHYLAEYASRDDVVFESEESQVPDFVEYLTDEHVKSQQETIENKNDHYLKYLDPFDHQYCYRFACGLSPPAAKKIIGYLKNRKDAGKFATLCILERSGKVQDALKDVKDLCSDIVNIHESDTSLLQRSTVQLLEIASANMISIPWLWLSECYSKVDLSGGNHLQLKSNLSIPVLTTLNKLTIQEYGREITAEEFTGILQHSSKCLALKEVWFQWCLLPQYVQTEYVSVLRTRNFKVTWYANHTYQLNLQSCLWERVDNTGNVMMTDDDYQKEVERVRKEQRRLRGDYN